MHVLPWDFAAQKLLYSVRTQCSAEKLVVSFFPQASEKPINKQQNGNFLYQIFRLLNLHVVHKVHQIGDVFYNLTFNKMHAAGSSLSTQVMTTRTLVDRYKMNILIVTLGG